MSDKVVDLGQFKKSKGTYIDVENVEIKGLADFLTPEEIAELEAYQEAGTLPEGVNYEAVKAFYAYCTEKLLPGINTNREAAGLPVLEGRVLTNAIEGDRWMRYQASKGGVFYRVTCRIFAAAERPKTGDWGHDRAAFIRGEARSMTQEAFAKISELLLHRAAVPSLKLYAEHFTYRDADRNPYGYAYSVRLKVPAVVAGMTLESLYARSEDIAKLVWPRTKEDWDNEEYKAMTRTVESVLGAISKL